MMECGCQVVRRPLNALLNAGLWVHLYRTWVKHQHNPNIAHKTSDFRGHSIQTVPNLMRAHLNPVPGV